MAIVGLSACGPSYRELNVAQIDHVEVRTDPQPFCAYAPVALRAVVTYKNGEQAQSRTPGEDQRGRLRTSEFAWSTNQGSVDADAVLTLPVDPLTWFDAPVAVNAHVVARPEMATETTVQPKFDCGGTLDVRGSAGARGGEAEDGGPGAPGPEVDVALAYLETARSGRLVLLRSQRDDDAPEYFVLDPSPSAKPVVIDARGGDGGRGGQGFAGRHGRDGIPGCTDLNRGIHGTDGEPGSPGGPGRDGSAGGPGGRVTVRYDARFPELRALVRVDVAGGAAGEAGDGGSGGFGGSMGNGCNAPDGAVGENGTDGPAGPSGTPGQPGVPGPAGETHDETVDVATLFAAELARGLPIVTGGAS